MQSFSLDESERPRNWLRARPSRTAARSRAAVRRFRTALQALQGCCAAVQPRTAAQPRSRLVIDIAYPLGTSTGFPLPRRVRRADGASLRLVRAARIQVGLGESGKHFHYSASQSICQSIIGPGRWMSPGRWKREI
jgi:hypothetical protein